MGNKRFKHLNELRVKAMAGDKAAAAALHSLLWVPHHLRTRGTVMDSVHKGRQFKRGLAITRKTLKPRPTSDAITIHPDYGNERLQMLKNRREARA